VWWAHCVAGTGLEQTIASLHPCIAYSMGLYTLIDFAQVDLPVTFANLGAQPPGGSGYTVGTAMAMLAARYGREPSG
jgi:hypothetical protein